ncbi:MAG: hypothetical protein KDC83_01220 [Flavobacteriales bacterium]|nr:hypothetical protein [Flavobacteriales bacterium]
MKRILDIGSWLLLLGGMFSLMSFSYYSRESQKYNDLQIKIDRPIKSQFITEEDVEELLQNVGFQLKDQKISSLDIQHIEKLLENNSSISSAEVYVTIDGRVVIELQERTPIIRIYNSFGESFYLDEEGSFMPLSNRYTARVLIAHGNVNIPFSTVYRLEDLETSLSRLFRQKNSSAVENTELFNKLKMNSEDLPGADQLKNLFTLGRFITSDPFWNAQISQIYVNRNGDLELTPRVGKHKIIFGSTENLEEKFSKLLLFYQKGLARTGWNEFTSINLKFKNQVVCTKK